MEYFGYIKIKSENKNFSDPSRVPSFPEKLVLGAWKSHSPKNLVPGLARMPHKPIFKLTGKDEQMLCRRWGAFGEARAPLFFRPPSGTKFSGKICFGDLGNHIPRKNLIPGLPRLIPQKGRGKKTASFLFRTKYQIWGLTGNFDRSHTKPIKIDDMLMPRSILSWTLNFHRR